MFRHSRVFEFVGPKLKPHDLATASQSDGDSVGDIQQGFASTHLEQSSNPEGYEHHERAETRFCDTGGAR